MLSASWDIPPPLLAVPPWKHSVVLSGEDEDDEAFQPTRMLESSLTEAE